MRQVTLAKSAGFCFGVKRAVNKVYEEAKKGRVYTYGPIIHNEEVVKAVSYTHLDVYKRQVVSAVRLRKVSVLKFVRLEKMSIQISEKFNKLLLKYCIKSNTISIAKFFKNFQYIDGGLINE